MRDYPDFLKQYTRAKEESADAFAEEMQDISDDGTNDWMEQFDDEGESTGWKLNGEHVQRSKLRIETRKWLASKLKPKKYGEKLELAGDQENPIRLDVATMLDKVYGKVLTQPGKPVSLPANSESSGSTK